jgi:hypothetical protein
MGFCTIAEQPQNYSYPAFQKKGRKNSVRPKDGLVH